MGMRFGILGHLMKVSDLKENIPISRIFPDSIVEWAMKHLSGKRGFWVASRVDVFGHTEGYLMAVLLTARQMMQLPKEVTRKRILDAILFAQNELNVEVIQLGALTTSLTEGGSWITEQKEYKGYVNHGDTFSTAVIKELMDRIAEVKGWDLLQKTVCIAGAYGIIGEALTKLMIGKCEKLILIGRRMEGFDRLKIKHNNISMTTDISAAREADIVITVTSHPGTLLKAYHLKKEAVIIDPAQPPNTSKELIKERPDILRLDGGLVKNMGIELGVNMGTPRGTMFACIAEVIMQALEGEKRNHVGSIDLNHLEKTKKWAKKWGFELAPFSCFGEPIEKLKGGERK